MRAILSLYLLVIASTTATAQTSGREVVVAISGGVGSRFYLSNPNAGHQSVSTSLSVAVRSPSDKLAFIADAAFTSTPYVADLNLKVFSAQIEHRLPLGKQLYGAVGFGAVRNGTLEGVSPIVALSYRLPINKSVEVSPRVTYWNPSLQTDYYNDMLSPVGTISIVGSIILR
jgi:hypothetical protein